MSELDFLIDTEDIVSINVQKKFLEYHLEIRFSWKMDCGCFDIFKRSFLTIITYEETYNKIIKDLKQHTGIVYKYILNHKNYTGELLDFRCEEYK